MPSSQQVVKARGMGYLMALQGIPSVHPAGINALFSAVDHVYFTLYQWQV
jgi:hypothetical protein